MLQQGLHITITADSVDVKTATSDSLFYRLLILAFAAFMAFKLSEVVPDFLWSLHHRAFGDLFYPMTVGFIFSAVIAWSIFAFIRSFFPAGSALLCDRTNLTISKIPTLNFHGRWKSNSFPLKEVATLQFAAVRYTKYGASMGITFRHNGKKFKVFDGLESPEASQILDGLQKLGADVVREPGMPMAVEMVMERRNSKLGKFLN